MVAITWHDIQQFTRKLPKIQFTELRIRENMGGLSHILYQKSFCHLQIANRKFIVNSIVLRICISKIFNSFPRIRWFWQRKQQHLNKQSFLFARQLAKIPYIFGIENSWNRSVSEVWCSGVSPPANCIQKIRKSMLWIG